MAAVFWTVSRVAPDSEAISSSMSASAAAKSWRAHASRNPAMRLAWLEQPARTAAAARAAAGSHRPGLGFAIGYFVYSFRISTIFWDWMMPLLESIIWSLSWYVRSLASFPEEVIVVTWPKRMYWGGCPSLLRTAMKASRVRPTVSCEMFPMLASDLAAF